MTEIRVVGDVALTWGESARWDDRRQRLYFVDCASQELHWLDGGEPPLQSMRTPGLPTGVVLADDGHLVVCVDDGLHLVEPDGGTSKRWSEYPTGLHGRANDATADGFGNLITGTLNLGAGPGTLWQFSAARGWTMLAEDMGNVNGPAVVADGNGPRLVVGDTVAGLVYAFDYDPDRARLGERQVLHDHGALDGAPDGSAVDAEGGVWSCVLRSGRIARLDRDGLDRVVDVPVPNPSDVAFGGSELDAAFVVSIALDLTGGGEVPPEAGRLLRLDGLDVRGRPEPRVSLG